MALGPVWGHSQWSVREWEGSGEHKTKINEYKCLSYVAVSWATVQKWKTHRNLALGLTNIPK